MNKPAAKPAALPKVLDASRLAHVSGGVEILFVKHTITSPRDASTGLPTGK
jgi:hypothetical protein